MIKNILMISQDHLILEPGSRWRENFGRANLPPITVLVATTKQGDKKNIENGNLVVVPVRAGNKLALFWKLFWRGLFVGLKLKRKGNLLVSSQDPFFLGIVAWKISFLLLSKLEVQLHTDVFSPGFYNFSLGNKVRYCLARFILPRADLIRVVSERVRKSILSIVKPDKIFILPVMSADITESSNQDDVAWPSADKRILMVGRLASEKRYHLAIRALAIINKSRPEVSLGVVGDGPELESLEKLVDRLGLKQNVIFFGRQKNIQSFYKTADLFLHTSAYEGYGLVLAESATAGLPIVSTDVGIAREAGSIITTDNVIDIADKITQALNLPKTNPRSTPAVSKTEYFEVLGNKWQTV